MILRKFCGPVRNKSRQAFIKHLAGFKWVVIYNHHGCVIKNLKVVSLILNDFVVRLSPDEVNGPTKQRIWNARFGFTTYVTLEQKRKTIGSLGPTRVLNNVSKHLVPVIDESVIQEKNPENVNINILIKKYGDHIKYHPWRTL